MWTKAALIVFPCALLSLGLVGACTRPASDAALGAGGSSGGQASGGSTTGGDGGDPGPTLPVLQGAPLIFAPTAESFGVNVLVGAGEPDALRLAVRELGTTRWREIDGPSRPESAVIQWLVDGLAASTRYEYVLFAEEHLELGGAGPKLDPEGIVYEGTAVTQRKAGESFDFTLITDTHISPRDVPPGGLSAYEYQETVLLELAPMIRDENPDFIVNLGDMLDFHVFGFNDPPPSGYYTALAYANYRRCLRDALGNAAHFPVVGNWDGENGSFTSEEIEYSRQARMAYVPGPRPDTYPEGGSEFEDYYAFTWGDALLVVLNVMTYTEKELLLDEPPTGSPDDWTLGDAQLSWLEATLEAASSKWKFLLIHHAVGGAGGTEANAVYGRGGGLAANVGEQARVHDLMLKHGVQIFFYGHDHVFTDIVVDGIHYTLPGSAGAPWKFSESETGYAESWLDSGYAQVRVTPDDVHVKFVSIFGEELLSYTVQ